MYSQSLTLPAFSLGTVSCQRNLPSASLKHMSTPASSLRFGLRGEVSFVPTKTFPPETVGLPCICEPSVAIHFRFLDLVVSYSSVFLSLGPGSHAFGRLISSEHMFRHWVPPH